MTAHGSLRTMFRFIGVSRDVSETSLIFRLPASHRITVERCRGGGDTESGAVMVPGFNHFGVF